MNPPRTPVRLSVSTLALHPLLGTVAPGRPGDASARMMESRAGSLDLMAVPNALVDLDARTMEICHFHVPDTSEAWLEDFRARREAAGVELWSLLIDDGDISDPVNGDRDRDWVLGWIDRAMVLGARCVRVIAGKQPPTEENLARSAANLKILAMEAYVRGLRVLTENWFALLPEPPQVHQLLGELGGAVGLTLDYGNWTGPDKHARLLQIAELAEGCHAKCDFAGGAPDLADFRLSLQVAQTACVPGPRTLVHGEPSDVWGSLRVQREAVLPFLES
ncbi:MAG: sugar phosphate isomerase/epimerase family protein [Armatimonadota bacterium]